jgi:hypothetical protein
VAAAGPAERRSAWWGLGSGVLIIAVAGVTITLWLRARIRRRPTGPGR